MKRRAGEPSTDRPSITNASNQLIFELGLMSSIATDPTPSQAHQGTICRGVLLRMPQPTLLRCYAAQNHTNPRFGPRSLRAESLHIFWIEYGNRLSNTNSWIAGTTQTAKFDSPELVNAENYAG